MQVLEHADKSVTAASAKNMSLSTECAADYYLLDTLLYDKSASIEDIG